MRNVDPAKIPDKGVRADMTLIKAGFTPNSDAEAITMQFVIDNGPHCGKKISHTFRPWERVTEETGKKFATPREAVDCFRGKCYQWRISAMVSPEKFKYNGKVGYTYNICFVDDARNEPDINLDPEPKQFQR